jgi:hypothetical protein
VIRAAPQPAGRRDPFDIRKEERINDASPHEDDIRRTEALFRFGAALPARDDFEHGLYREWHARDAQRLGSGTYGCAPHLRGLTPGQLRELAEVDAQERVLQHERHASDASSAGQRGDRRFLAWSRIVQHPRMPA